MRRAFPFLLFCCLGLILKAQGSIDADNGILGYQLGASADQMEGIVKDGKQERLIRYRPLDDSLRFQNILTRKVRLFFWEGNLHSIEVKLQGAEADKMLLWLKGRYGEGRKEDAMGFKYAWEGSRVRIFWEQNLVNHDAILNFMDDTVHAKYYKYMKSLQ